MVFFAVKLRVGACGLKSGLIRNGQTCSAVKLRVGACGLKSVKNTPFTGAVGQAPRRGLRIEIKWYTPLFFGKPRPSSSA